MCQFTPAPNRLSSAWARRWGFPRFAPPRETREGRRARKTRGGRTYASDLDSGTSQSAEGGLRSWAWGLGLVSSGRSQLYVKGGDAELLAPDGDVLGGKHSGVWARLVAIGLDLHTSRHANQGLPSGEVGHVDEGVVEGGVDVGNAVDDGVGGDVGAELLLLLTGGHVCNAFRSI